MGMVKNVVGCKWSLTVLSMVRHGIPTKKSLDENPPRVDDRLTAFGRKFSGLIEQIEILEAQRSKD